MWRKWYASGAVKQQGFPENSLIIDAIITDHKRNYVTLCLGRKVINSGPEWSVTSPLCHVHVPILKRGYRIGVILPEIPKNAVPSDAGVK